MLPPRLSEDLCSLRSGEDKLTISVIFTINKDGLFTKEPSIVESVIFCDKNLNYNEVEQIIEDQTTTKEFFPVKMLYDLSHALRIKRLGTGAFFLYDADHLQDSSNFKSHQLVEEWMIEANKHVAGVLLKAYPDSTILVQHLPPREELYTIWKDNFKHFLPNMLYFDPHRLQLPCLGNVPQYVMPKVEIKEDIWKAIENAVNCDDWKTAFTLVCQEQKHPQHAHVLQQWFSIQMHRRVTCSAYVKPNEIVHSGMNIGPYTQFTSPVRRYIDLIVHRLLKAHLGNMASPYNSEAVQKICHLYNLGVLKQKHFSKDCDCLAYAFKLSSDPVRPHYTIVEAMEEDHILFRNPDYNFVPKRCETIKYASLSLQEKPELPEDNKARTVLAWGKRIYDQIPNESQALSVSQTELDTKRHVRQIAGRDWQIMLDKFMKGDQDGSKNFLQKIVKNVKRRQVDPYLTSESPGGGMIFDHFKQFSLLLKGGDVLKLFFTAEIERGFLRPRVQILSLTDQFHLCVHHKENPIICFEDMASKASKERYRDIDEYQQIWRPILSMESAYEAVKSDESFYINNVKITWIQDEKNNLPVYKGQFSLGKEFCKQRHIFFMKDVNGDEVEDSDADEDEDESDSEETNDLEHFSEYLCIICPRIPAAAQTYGEREQMGERDKGESYIWTGHGVITGVKEQGSYIHFKLHDKSCHPTEKMLQQPSVCTLEVIPKTSTDKRMEHAIENLDKASTLAKGIATGNLSDIDKTREGIKVPKEFIEDSQKKLERYIAKMNFSQKNAVTEALNSPFSLIQGPPGTGKTWTALNMLYILNEWNKQGLNNADPDTSPKILVCGPSNKSLDHLASMMMYHFNQKDKENICPNFVRVYSDTIVSQDFPVPTQPVHRRSWKKMSTNGDEEDDTEIDVHCIPQSLHYLIRECSNRYSKKILQFDEMFKTEPLLVTHEDVTKYKATVAKAEQEALQQAEVILCTCSVSGSQKLTGLNFRQLMIDEAAMCMEPETMVPIVASNAYQVILLGDHRQLRPVVPLKAASDLGLALSLFERYSYKAMMLKTQYRMHETICQFPSEKFYGGKLETDSSLKGKSPELEIWSGRDEPQAIVFCCTEGKETTLPVATREGSERSKSNEDEMKHVVRMYKNLVTKHNIEPSNIVVLSQYKAQVYAIKKELEKIIPYPNVSTVVGAQGGEWDYVLLSTVRSLPDYDILERPTLGWRKKNLGFIIDSNQVNVALTRAKKGLIIVGNDNLLKVDKVWKSLLEYYQEKGCVVNAEDFLPEEIEMPLIERPKRKTPKDQYEMFADRKKFIADLPPRFRNHEMFRDHVKPKMNLNEENYTDTEVASLSTSTGTINSSLSSQSRGTSTPGTPPCFDYESNIAGELYYYQFWVDEQGGILTLPGTGVSLYVPPGALESQTLITLGITRREQDKLPVGPDQAQTSPVVFCEPHGLMFKKMIFLTISHCIPDVHGLNTQKNIWSSETGFDECCDWKLLKDNYFSMFLHNRCIIGLHHFTKHSTSCNKKKMQVQAYGQLYDVERRKLNLNVHCIADLPDEREKLEKEMSKLQFKYLDYRCIIVYLCEHHKECSGLCLEIGEFENCWKLTRKEDHIQEVSYLDLVEDIDTRAVFRLEPADGQCPSVIECEIKIYKAQLENDDNTCKKIVITKMLKELLMAGDSLKALPNGNHSEYRNLVSNHNAKRDENTQRKEAFEQSLEYGEMNGNSELPYEGPRKPQNEETTRKELEESFTRRGDSVSEHINSHYQLMPNGTLQTAVKSPDVRPKVRQGEHDSRRELPYTVELAESVSGSVNPEISLEQSFEGSLVQYGAAHGQQYAAQSDSQFITCELWDSLSDEFKKVNVWGGILKHLNGPPNCPIPYVVTMEVIFNTLLKGDVRRLYLLCMDLCNEALLEGDIINQVKEACRYKLEKLKIISSFRYLICTMNPEMMRNHLVAAGMIEHYEEDQFNGPMTEANRKLLNVILKAEMDKRPYSTLRKALLDENLSDCANKLKVREAELHQFFYPHSPQHILRVGSHA
ncbi:helicase with zinc finger domain 2-like [Lingula anatina]|uniref:Helicase with zinc finger domain 2-like n=1 Tax=Lingula anatina TaxID=7574 RepID=A0A2R2MN27_LINAN|nr:helicase with zinc finger domain 2-like [Lingula anatina]|eukprot:XP_023931638.1 helicase with zinc finger domain 2-like [Lingula anatina]